MGTMEVVSSSRTWIVLSLLLLATLDFARGFLISAHVNLEAPWRRHCGCKSSAVLFAKNGGGGDGEVMRLIHSHHLLDHKPDNMILKGSKFKLRGVATLGRPGAGLCVGAPASIDKFLKKLQQAMPQKKFSSIDIDLSSTTDANLDGFEQVSLGEFRQVLFKLGQEEHFFAITGIDPSIAVNSNTGGNSGETEASSGVRKNGGGKKKRKRR